MFARVAALPIRHFFVFNSAAVPIGVSLDYVFLFLSRLNGSSTPCPTLLVQSPVRATSSRFLSRRGFLLWRILLAAYFLFWSIFWPFVEGVDDAHEFVTYWAWYMATICECTTVDMSRCFRRGFTGCLPCALSKGGRCTSFHWRFSER